jgi:hypothetical protein
MKGIVIFVELFEALWDSITFRVILTAIFALLINWNHHTAFLVPATLAFIIGNWLRNILRSGKLDYLPSILVFPMHCISIALFLTGIVLIGYVIIKLILFLILPAIILLLVSLAIANDKSELENEKGYSTSHFYKEQREQYERGERGEKW